MDRALDFTPGDSESILSFCVNLCFLPPRTRVTKPTRINSMAHTENKSRA